MSYVKWVLEQEIISLNSKKNEYYSIKELMDKDKYVNNRVIEMIEHYDELINKCEEAIKLLSEAERN